MQSNQKNSDVVRKNRRVASAVFLLVLAMVGLSFASVPLYSLFCRVTGYGGTTQVSRSAPDKILERTVKVRFFSDTASDLPWKFVPEIRDVNVRIGERALISYKAESLSDSVTSGTAVYNVTPAKVGRYFHKIQCFCFGLQSLEPRQKVSMPVVFFLDPAMAEDPALDEVSVVTLSYTFYRADSKGLEKAVEAFYEE